MGLEPDFFIKRGDLLKPIEGTLKDADDVVVDLSAAVSVRFIMTAQGESTPTVDRPATIVSPASNGDVQYDWIAGDTDVAGTYYAEWKVMFSGGKPLTFPNDGHIVIEIGPDLGN